MQIYQKDCANPVFLVRLIDQFGVPVTGVESPTVLLSKSQGANGTKVVWVENTDFTWHEIVSEALKGVYKLRQRDSPNVSAVDTAGQCALGVYKTDAATAHGVAAYQVNTLLGDAHLMKAFAVNKAVKDKDAGTLTIYDDDGVTELAELELTDDQEAGTRTRTPV